MKKSKIIGSWIGVIGAIASVIIPSIICTKQIQNNQTNITTQAKIIENQSNKAKEGGLEQLHLEGKTINAVDLSAFVTKSYPDGTIVISTGEKVENVFTDMEKKFPQEFEVSSTNQDTIGVYSKNAANIFKKMVVDHPNEFITGFPEGWTGTIDINNFWTGNPTFAYVSDPTNPNKSAGILKITSTVSFNQNNYYYQGNIDVQIQGMLHSETVVSEWASTNFVIPENNILKKCIPEDVIGPDIKPEYKTEVKELITKNLNNILDNAPLTTKLVADDSNFKITQNEHDSSAVNIEFAINKYANDNGKLFYDKLVVGIKTSSNLRTITLRGFQTPQEATTPNSLTSSQLGHITGITGTPWENIADKYANDFVSDSNFKSKAIETMTTLINDEANLNTFFINPVDQTKNPVQNRLPIIKRGSSLSLELVKNGDTTDYAKLYVVGEFLSYSKNPSVEITSSSYTKMKIEISGFRTQATKVREPNIFSVDKDPFLSKLIPTEVAKKGVNELVKFLNVEVNNGTILEGHAQNTEVTIKSPEVNIQVNQADLEAGQDDRITVTFHVDKSYADGGVPNKNDDHNNFTIILNGFTRPNKKITAGKTTSIKDLASQLSNSIDDSLIKGISNSFSAEVTPNVMGENDYNRIVEAFENSINNKPELYFDNPVIQRDTNLDGTEDQNDLSIVKKGTKLQLKPEIDTAITYHQTNLSIKGWFLCRQENPNNPLLESDYKELTITLTNFKNGQTEAAAKPLAAGDSIKQIVVSDAKLEQNALAIQQFINKDDNITRLLDNAVYYRSSNVKTKATIMKDKTGEYSIKSDPADKSGIQIKLSVINYIDENCIFESNPDTPKTITAKMTGFDSIISEDDSTIAKSITAQSLSNFAYQDQISTGIDYAVLKNIDTRMAMDFLTKDNLIDVDVRQGWGAKGVQFVEDMIRAINTDPSLFFENPVTNDPENRPYVKVDPNWNKLPSGAKYPNPDLSPLLVEFANDSKINLNITGEFLVKPLKTSDKPQYERRTITVTDFNRNATMFNSNNTPSINSFVYEKDGVAIEPGKETAQAFIGRSTEEQGAIIINFATLNMDKVFKNISYDTKIVRITEPKVYVSSDISDYRNNRSVETQISLKHYSRGEGDVVESNATKEIKVIITGFKEPNQNEKLTQAKVGLTADDLYTYFSSLEGYKTIKDIGNYFVASYDSEQGFLAEQFLSDITDAINKSPEFFFDNYVEKELNKNELPVVKQASDGSNEIEVRTTFPTSSSDAIDPEINITGYFLSQPEIQNQQVSVNDYKKYTITIKNGTTHDFSKGHKTSINTKNTTGSAFDIRNEIFDTTNMDLMKYTYEDIVDNPIDSQEAIKSFIERNKGVIFNNITREMSFVDTVKIKISDSDPQNKVVYIAVGLIGYTQESGIFETSKTKGLTFHFHLKGFKDPDIVIQNDSDKSLLMYAAVGSGILGVLLLVFATLYRRNIKRKRTIIDNQFDSFF